MKKVIDSCAGHGSVLWRSVCPEKVKGSDTVLPLSQKEAEAYSKKNPGASVVVTGGGSGVGIAALISGSTDIAMASRKIKFDEKVKIQEAGQAFTEVIVAWDALAVVVNPSNKVGQLTREQLEGDLYREDHELESGGWREPQDRGVLARKQFRDIRVL